MGFFGLNSPPGLRIEDVNFINTTEGKRQLQKNTFNNAFEFELTNLLTGNGYEHFEFFNKVKFAYDFASTYVKPITPFDKFKEDLTKEQKICGFIKYPNQYEDHQLVTLWFK